MLCFPMSFANKKTSLTLRSTLSRPSCDPLPAYIANNPVSISIWPFARVDVNESFVVKSTTVSTEEIEIGSGQRIGK